MFQNLSIRGKNGKMMETSNKKKTQNKAKSSKNNLPNEHGKKKKSFEVTTKCY